MKRKIGYGFLIFAGTLLALYFGVSQKVYPVATVNNAFISARSFEAASVAASKYYGRVFELSEEVSSITKEFNDEMRRIALQALIEDQLVRAELEQYYEPASLEAAVTARVDSVLASTPAITADAVYQLFGLSFDDFKEVVLGPEARLELLQKEMEMKGGDALIWLEDARLKAQVSITATGFSWENGQVELIGPTSYTAKVKELIDEFASTTEAIQAVSSTPQQ